jgi:hypothetical protein
MADSKNGGIAASHRGVPWRPCTRFRIATLILLGLLFGSNVERSIKLGRNYGQAMDQFAILPNPSDEIHGGSNQIRRMGTNDVTTTTTKVSPSDSVSSNDVQNSNQSSTVLEGKTEGTKELSNVHKNSPSTTSSGLENHIPTTMTSTNENRRIKGISKNKTDITTDSLLTSITYSKSINGTVDETQVDWSDLMFHMHGHDDDAIVVESHKLVFFPIAKNGSTEWKIL